MKKIGKFLKRVEKAPEKQTEVQSSLLRTYFTSLFSLVLCVTMFLGTSYAWFSSEVTNTGNEIYIGTLEVDMQKKDGETWVSLSQTVQEGQAPVTLFDKNIRWEPGYTTLETIQIVNKGDLAFKYILNFTDGSLVLPETEVNSNVKIEDIAKHFEVWVYDHANGELKMPATFADITMKDEENPWAYAGDLDKLLAGEVVLMGQMKDVRKAAGTTVVGTFDGEETAHTYTIALHMKESATSEVMGRKIMLNVKLVAYQMASEQNAFGENKYDELDAVHSSAEWIQAAQEGNNVVLTSDIAIESDTDRVVMNGGALDGNGHTVTYNGEKVNGYSAGVLITSGGTITNLTIVGGDNGRGLYVGGLTTDLVVSKCTLSGVYAFNLNSSEKTNYLLSFTNTIFRTWTSFANAMEHAYFINCIFDSVLKPYGDTTLTDCVFALQKLDLTGLEEGETIHMVNCSYGGTVIEDLTVKVNGGKIELSDTALFEVKVEDDGQKLLAVKADG